MRFDKQKVAERLKDAIKRRGYESPSDFARKRRLTGSTVLSHCNGGRGLRPDVATKYAEMLRVDPAWLLYGEDGAPSGDPSAPPVPVLGYVGAGSTIYPIDDHPQGGGMEEEPEIIEPAVRVAITQRDGFPPFSEGWRVDLAEWEAGVPDRWLRKLCLVELEDGRQVLRRPFPGTKAGTYHLQPMVSGDPIEDAQVKRSAFVVRLRPP